MSRCNFMRRPTAHQGWTRSTERSGTGGRKQKRFAATRRRARSPRTGCWDLVLVTLHRSPSFKYKLNISCHFFYYQKRDNQYDSGTNCGRRRVIRTIFNQPVKHYCHMRSHVCLTNATSLANFSKMQLFFIRRRGAALLSSGMCRMYYDITIVVNKLHV